MATYYQSSNPFRRKTSLPTTTSAPAEQPPVVNHIAYQQTDLQSTNSLQNEVPKKVPKKVRVQSPPPPSSPSIPDSSSTIGEDSYSISVKPPTPIPRDEDDPFDGTSQDSSEDEALPVRKQAGAPANPFQKTLETMENPQREGLAISPTNVPGTSRASMDVDSFKRLIMTGNAGLGISTPTNSHMPAQHGLGDGGSSTDASSLSRQSIFEAVQEAHPESPRTSHEISEPEDDRRTADISTAGRKKPPPPSSRHGKLIKVELRDDPATISLAPSASTTTSPAQIFNSSFAQRSQTDLNKPLPPAPARASHDSERESIFDKEAAGKTPEPPSPSASLRRKNPPAPPLARRHSQLVSDSKLSIRNDSGRLSPKAEEDASSITSAIDIGRPRSDSGRAPPPPPSRRPASVRVLSNHNPLTTPSSVSLPPVPPARGSSRSISSGRPPSVSSMDISSAPASSTGTPSKRASMMPPPPPPPRHGRNSMDEASRRTSAEHGRPSTENVRRGSETSLIHHTESVESPELIARTKGPQDILAEMSKLQREIDALRVKSLHDA